MSDEFNYSFGEQGKGSEHTGLAAYGLDLNHTINDSLSTDIFYTNQGHFPEHHRDGAGASLMLNKQLLPQLTVSVGAGPWAYCDTLIPDNGKPAQDLHGIGATAGVAAAWHAKNHIVYQVRANYYTAKDSFSSYSAVGSIGYEFGGDAGTSSFSQSDSSSSDNSSDNSGKNQISMLAGESAVNVPGNVRSLATSVEYRRELGKSLDLTVAGISEGNNKFADRSGVAPELWLRENVLDNRLSFSIGAGVYAGVDQRKEQEGYASDKFAAAIVSTSANYKFTDHWNARLTWHRVLTSYDRDADVVVAGFGYEY
jgi:hypothetical protein